jgi:hypothetical protein
MDAIELLRQMTIADPCCMGWNTMRGDEHKRHCESCGKHVYNFTAIQPSEAAALLNSRQPEICGVVYKKPDGTLFLFDDQPVPESGPVRWQFRIRSLMGIIAGVAAALGVARPVTVADPPVPAQPKKPAPASVTRVMGALRERSYDDPIKPPYRPSVCSQSEAYQ